MYTTSYNIELLNKELECVVIVSISSLGKKSSQSTSYPSKRKACESIKYRFSDIDFENDTLLFNGIRVSTKFELIKLMDKELLEEPVDGLVVSEFY
jgi:hypothetical protein